MNREYDELLQAYKKNKRTVQGERLHAVCMIKISGDMIADTARRMFCSYQGQNGLSGTPGTGGIF